MFSSNYALQQFLRAFAELRKPTIELRHVCLSVRMGVCVCVCRVLW